MPAAASPIAQRHPLQLHDNFQEKLWENLFSKPWGEWLEDRLDKKRHHYHPFSHQFAKGGLWLKHDHHHRPAWMDFRLLDLDLLLQAPQRHLQGKHRVIVEIQRLCDQRLLNKAIGYLGQDHGAPHDEQYVTLLKACYKRKAPQEAKKVCAYLRNHHVALTERVGDHLVMTLAKCRALDDAYNALISLQHRTVISWTAMISGYAECGRFEEALSMHQCMLDDHVEPNQYTYIVLFKSCARMCDLLEARKLHNKAQLKGLLSDIFLGSALVKMYGNCGSVVEAEEVFVRLSEHDMVSWSAMLTAYVDQGQHEKALHLYRQMQEEGISTDRQVFAIILQACSALVESEKAAGWDVQQTPVTCLEIGKGLHADARKKGFVTDLFVGSTLLSLYGRDGRIMEAENVFNGLFMSDIVLWTMMLDTYVEQGKAKKALLHFRQMHVEGMDSDEHALVVTLQACGVLREKEAVTGVNAVSLKIGKALHADCQKKGFEADIFVGSTLVSMYGKCGCIMEAENVFCELLDRNAVSWNAMLSALVEQHQGEKALCLYRQMQEEGLGIDHQTFVIMLQACGAFSENAKAAQSGKLMLDLVKALHCDAIRMGFMSDILVGTNLMVVYGKNGGILEAEYTFDGLLMHDVMSWSVMLSAYVEHGHLLKVLQLYRQMLKEGVNPREQLIVSALQACCSLLEREEGSTSLSNKVNVYEIGKALHCDAERMGFGSNVFIGSTLLNMYSKFGGVMEAENTFEGLLERDDVCWSVMLSVYLEHSEVGKVLHLYRQMVEEGVRPDEHATAIVVEACGAMGEREGACRTDGSTIGEIGMEIGKALHADAQRKGFDGDAFVGSSLVTMYGKYGSIHEAEIVLACSVGHDIVQWNALLSAYVEQGHGGKALQMYSQMQVEGLGSNQKTLVIVIQACSTLVDKRGTTYEEEGQSAKWLSLEICRALHMDAQRLGFMSDIFVPNTLLSIYGKCGSTMEAQNLFDTMPAHDVVSWSAMIASYVEWGQGEKALQLYKKMREEKFTPNDITVVSILQACSDTGRLDLCMELHFSIISACYEGNLLIANTLIRAYGSSSSMADAQAVLDGLVGPDVVSWTACIAGHAQQGDCGTSMHAVGEIWLAGFCLEGVTLLSLLSACSHASLIDEGIEYFESMVGGYCAILDMRHYVIMIDLLGRAGDFNRVKSLLLGLPMQVDIVGWLTLLSACRTHGNVELGMQVFLQAVGLHCGEAAAYVLMSNVYSGARLQEHQTEVE